MDERTTAVPPPPLSDAPDAPAPAAPGKQEQGSVKDTVESILVAFILAFIFRAFIVEAFVIPTGSMAPTLLGAHMRFLCADCGLRFDANYSPDQSRGSDEIPIPSRAGPTLVRDRDRFGRETVRWEPKVYKVHCPNCGYRVARPESTNPPVHYGDRILVLKYLYLFGDPARWDVVVFKSPDDYDDYEQNYIKRLVGRPNESVMILDGDVYAGPNEARFANEFVVQPKPRHVQEVLWRIVHDNDHLPRGLDRGGDDWEQPWKPQDGAGGGGWDVDGRVFRFDNAGGTGTIAFDREANPNKSSLTDWLAYDVENQRLGNAVSDLKLDLYYHRTAGDGPLRLSLTKYDDEFVAELTPTEARLIRRRAGGPDEQVGEAVALAHGPQPVRVEFENVDYRVALRVDGRELIATTPEQYRPDVDRLMKDVEAGHKAPFAHVAISAANQTGTISHLSLWRDIYYINTEVPGQTAPRWAVPARFPEHVIRLGPGEYFVLGDNSLISGDARFWSRPIDLPAERLSADAGRVPERFMLGKAFFVYWPAGYKPADVAPAIIPNFGGMRFIH